MPIRILDAATVGRIAAGEVVERPSSVAKELVENSLDAGATAVTVEIRGGGIEYLRVTDNGCGIEPGQVRLAFENHATSKLQNADQLNDIRTLGFRGEALPSIASVSHVEMTPRAKGQDSGVRLNVDGGHNLRVKDYGCPEGTTFVMRDLFYNIPVRRSFLKKASYEGGLVGDVVSRLAIGNPGVSMRFINNGNTVFHTFGDGKLRHAIFAVYGKSTAEQMIGVDACEGGTRIFGLIGVGELGKSTRAHQMFFINGRSVRCPLLSKALEEVCRSSVTIGMYPMCALNLVLPANAIDVNVHPNKLEVRFRDEDTTRPVVEHLLQSGFAGEKVLSIERDAAPVKEIRKVSTVRRITPDELSKMTLNQKDDSRAEQPQDENRMQTDMFLSQLEKERARYAGNPAYGKDATGTRLREHKDVVPVPSPAADPEAAKPEVRASDKVEPRMPDLLPKEAKDQPSYRVLGVAFKTYIILETEDALLLIDQHAAHERLRYEMYVQQLEEGMASQQLLVPLVIRLSSREMALIQDNQDALTEAGYTVEPFGDNDIQVRAVPHILGRAEIKPIFMDMINSLSRLKSATLDARRGEIMQMACKSAGKGGDPLTESEIESLIHEMMETGAPPTCPYGRPVVKAVSRRDLEKMFKRIQ